MVVPLCPATTPAPPCTPVTRLSWQLQRGKLLAGRESAAAVLGAAMLSSAAVLAVLQAELRSIIALTQPLIVRWKLLAAKIFNGNDIWRMFWNA